MNSTLLRIAIGTLLLLSAIGGMVSRRAHPEVRISPERAALGPGFAGSVGSGPATVLPNDAALTELVGQLRKSRLMPDKIHALCLGLRLLMPGNPVYPEYDSPSFPSRPLEPSETLSRWRQCTRVDPLSVAYLARQICEAAGLSARLVITESTGLLPEHALAGIEVWDLELGWRLVDTTCGHVFYLDKRPLSSLELREAMDAGRPVSIVKQAGPVALLPLETVADDYRVKLARILVPSFDSDGWRLSQVIAERPTPLALRPGTLAAAAAIAFLFACLASAAVRRSVWLCLLMPPLCWVGNAWKSAMSVEAPRRRAGGRTWALLALAGTAALVAQVVYAQPIAFEDAYISFRYARNLALGNGLTFNAGEQGTEGFSNLLWVLVLAAGHFVWADPIAFALGCGVLLQSICIAVTARIALQLGAGAPLAILLISTNTYVVRNCANGLETALVTLLTTLVAWSWIEEERRGDIGLLTTAILCGLVALARAEGWYLFLIVSALRLLGSGESPAERGRLIRYWVLPFGLLFGTLEMARYLVFGSLVPEVYYARLLDRRGTLSERLIPGLRYVWQCFETNPALFFGAYGLLFWRSHRAAARVAAIVVGHLAMVTGAGGDADYIGGNRFMMPIVPCLALLAQVLFQSGMNTSAGRTIIPVVGSLAILAGNAIEVDRTRPGPPIRASLLGSVFLQSPSASAEILSDGLAHIARGDVDGSRWSFDGRVSRHLAETLDTSEELVCSQAGQLAWTWPGRFRDLLGLASRPPYPSQFVHGTCSGPKWYLLHFDEFVHQAQELVDRGYRVERVYAKMGEQPCREEELFVLLGLQTTDEPDKDFMELVYRQAPWWHLGRRKLVLFSARGDAKALYDGPREVADREQLRTLPAAVRENVLSLWPKFPDL